MKGHLVCLIYLLLGRNYRFVSGSDEGESLCMNHFPDVTQTEACPKLLQYMMVHQLQCPVALLIVFFAWRVIQPCSYLLLLVLAQSGWSSWDKLVIQTQESHAFVGIQPCNHSILTAIHYGAYLFDTALLT